MSRLSSALQRSRWTPVVRYLVLLAWGVFWMMPPANYTLHMTNDWIPFEIGARTIVHYHHMIAFSEPALHLFADTPMLQFGPLPVWLLAAFQTFSPYRVAIGFGIAMIAAGVASFAALEAAARTLVDADRHQTLRRMSLALQAVLVPVWSYEVGYWHHIDDVIALTCISFALLIVARQGSWWALGLLLGTAAATKPWAVIAVPLLIALPRTRWAATTLVTFATVAAWWAPFVIAAPNTIHELGSFEIVPTADSVIHLFGITTNGVNWLRPLQMGAGMAAVGLLARRGRWDQAVLAGMAMRVLLDPYAYSYYALGPIVGALLLDLVAVGRTRVPRWTMGTLALVWLLPRLDTHVPIPGARIAAVQLPTAIAVTRLVWAVAVIGLLVLPALQASRRWVRAREARATTA